MSLLEGLSELGVEARVALPQNGPVLAELAQRGIRVHVAPFRGWVSEGWGVVKLPGRIGLAAAGAIRIALAVRTWQPDVIYTNTSVIPVGALVAAFLRRPHVWHIREFGWEDYGLRFDLGQTISARIMSSASARVICISHALAFKYSQWINPGKIEVIYNPIAMAGNSATSPVGIGLRSRGEINLAIVGVLAPGKGHEDALHGLKVLLGRGIPARLLVVGDGNLQYKRGLQILAAQLGVHHAVEFLGFVGDPWRALRGTDALLVCSRAEAFGRVTAEAMARRIPVIGARSAGTMELIGPSEERGFLYEPGDAMSLARAVERLMTDNVGVRERVERAAGWVALECDPRRVAERVYAILQEAVHTNRLDGGSRRGSVARSHTRR